jgi:hypothetical protein
MVAGELRVYLDVPETGITRLYPREQFPPLPDAVVNSPTELGATTGREVNQERNWYFSLTDFTLQRLGNQILNSFYFASWASLLEMSTDAIISQSAGFLHQLDEV